MSSRLCKKRSGVNFGIFLQLFSFPDKVRMDFLVNFSPTGQGIHSLVSDNMTCRCDSLSCHCFHTKFGYTEPEHVVRVSGEDPL